MKRIPPTTAQIDYLATLCSQLGYDIDEHDRGNLVNG
jgi:hypothetical protein